MFRNRILALATAATLVLSMPSAVLAQKDDKKRSKQEKAEIEALVKLVDGVMAGQPAPTDISMTLTPFFLKSQDPRTFVPFQLGVQGAPSADVALYVRVVDPAKAAGGEGDDKKKDDKKVEYPWDDIHFVPAAQVADGSVDRVFMAAPGTYDVYIAMKERMPEKAPKNATFKTGLLKTSVTVPDLSAEFTTSSVLVADKVNMLQAPLSADEARERPFAFGAQELIPATDENFKKSEELSIFFQVYNPSLDSAGKPDITMEYNFHKKEGSEEKFFNKTNPQTINASNLPPQFDPAKFPVPGGITVPLQSFGEGEYRLEIKITDKAGNKTLTRNVPFKVTAS